MKVILKENVEGLGIIGDVVTVKPGYARNFLLPQGLVIEASSNNLTQLEHEKRMLARKREKVMDAANLLKQKIEGLSLEFTAKASEDGKLFGSVTNIDIADRMAAAGVEIDRRKIAIDEAIKSVGEHEAQVKLDAGIVATAKVVVKAEEE